MVKPCIYKDRVQNEKQGHLITNLKKDIGKRKICLKGWQPTMHELRVRIG
jgi:hypothetical protein